MIFKKIVDFFRYDSDGYDNNGYDREGFDKSGYCKDGYDRSGYNRNGFNRLGYNRQGFDRSGWNKEGYDPEGFDKNGHNVKGFNRIGDHRETGSPYDPRGYDQEGFDKEGYDRSGWNKEGRDRNGFDRNGYDKDGYNRLGFNKVGIHKLTGDQYGPNGTNNQGKTKKQVAEQKLLDIISDDFDIDFDELVDCLLEVMPTLHLESEYGTQIKHGNNVMFLTFSTQEIINFKCDNSTELGMRLITKKVGSKLKLMNDQMGIILSQSSPK